MQSFGFSKADATRIGNAIRRIEKQKPTVQLGGVDQQPPPSGVRMLLAKHSGASWPTGSTAVVTVYTGDVGSVVTAGTLVAYNHYINFNTAGCATQWVKLGHNGFQWHPIDAQGECGTCISLVGGIDFRAINGYVHTNTQFLGHDGSGCIQWYNTQTCATA